MLESNVIMLVSNVNIFVSNVNMLVVVNAAFLFFETSKLWALIMYIL